MGKGYKTVCDTIVMSTINRLTPLSLSVPLCEMETITLLMTSRATSIMKR